MKGKESKSGKETISSLEFSVINPKNLPEDPHTVGELAKSVASLLKKSLKDANQYDVYRIVFVSSDGNDIVEKAKTLVHEFSA
ncbi:MAG: hypothetical protein EOO50_07415 [Flavobacterium sp.]|uniref:hypothetical protein n=1 Tax=Flavobacterium sp. TaxID=239 RepID=UPI00122A7EDE|nr:hypothetical protein [Flavobacterium sp.]RZJ67083.1 MAG: hypothetical protein EOO50_07415 [Flavobacterium sp.]